MYLFFLLYLWIILICHILFGMCLLYYISCYWFPTSFPLEDLFCFQLCATVANVYICTLSWPCLSGRLWLRQEDRPGEENLDVLRDPGVCGPRGGHEQGPRLWGRLLVPGYTHLWAAHWNVRGGPKHIYIDYNNNTFYGLHIANSWQSSRQSAFTMYVVATLYSKNVVAYYHQKFSVNHNQIICIFEPCRLHLCTSVLNKHNVFKEFDSLEFQTHF